MKRKDAPQALSDILLKDIGLNINELTSAVEASRNFRKAFPILRFEMTHKDAFLLLLRCYQYEVQSRNCVFELDECTIDVLKNISGHMVERTPKPGLLLCGLHGNGKTTMARAIIRMIQDLNNRGQLKFMGEYFSVETRYIKATDICTLHKAEDYHSILNLKQTPFLVIDDLGEEAKEVLVYGTPIYPVREVLEARYDTLKFTILTSNLSPKDLPEHYGWRVVDRFKEMLHQVAFKGKSYRKRERTENKEESPESNKEEG